MKAFRSLVAVIAISSVSFAVASAHGDKSCTDKCNTKSSASKSGDKCCTPKTAKAKKADTEKTADVAKKS
jgi:hypothetical protein